MSTWPRGRRPHAHATWRHRAVVRRRGPRRLRAPRRAGGHVTTPRQLRRRPSESDVLAALSALYAAAASTTTLTAAEASAFRLHGGRSARRVEASAVRVAVARALVSRRVLVKDAIRHVRVGPAVYARGVPHEHAAALREALRAAEAALPDESTPATRRDLARRTVDEVALERGLAAAEVLTRNTVAAREARGEVVRRLRATMSNAEAAQALGFTRLTCYRLAKGGYHTTDDRRRPRPAPGRQRHKAPSTLGRHMLERSAEAVGLDVEAVLSRTDDLAVTARWGAWVAMREAGLSLHECGQRAGGRDHTTVIYAMSRVPGRLAAGDEALLASIEAARAVVA